MNHRFLSVLGLAVTLSFINGCNPNKATTNGNRPGTVITKPTNIKSNETVPVWAPKKNGFNPSRTLEHDLIHTKLRVSFDWEKQYLNGLAELTLKPYFYAQNHLSLDAKGMEIKSVNLMKGYNAFPLQFKYDGLKLNIELDKSYTRNEEYIIEINYVAKPNELKLRGSDAITQDKGLYFVNPLGTEPNKPKQIWTQGETESNSAWFPTIDAPNERMTQEVYITVDPRYTTLSNGTFMYSRQNADGTKTDYWKQDLPHAPYLTMLAVGDFAVVKDKWRNKEVNYYVEPAYKGTAKKIFGNTPEMMEYFSNKLGVVYPWSKYSQIVVRDFVSGAMENTSASVFMEDLQLNELELLDKNWDGIIAHELFHQWFGDLVTTESWANLPLNEAFANYSEYLWAEYKYGADEAEYGLLEELHQYLDEAETKREPLIRYYHADREDMFDSHSYSKGGRVLHMLRRLVGDEAWWASLNHYLNKNKFSAVEVAELRMAFEDVTGKDLMWFFDQWFMKPGHPELKVQQNYANGQLNLTVQQNQDTTYMPVYVLPLEIAVWVNGNKKVYPIIIDKATQTFSIAVVAQPDLVVFDADKQLLGTIEHQKAKKELVYQFRNSKHLVSKVEALDGLTEHLSDPEVTSVFETALEDKYWRIRSKSINILNESAFGKDSNIENKMVSIARNDVKGAVRADAVLAMAKWGGDKYKSMYEQAMRDSSYLVTAAGILAYSATGASDTMVKLSKYDNEKNEDVILALASYYALHGGVAKYEWFVNKINNAKGGALYYLLQSFGAYLATNPEKNTAEAITLLSNLAQSHPIYYVRGSAYQALLVMSDRPEVKQILMQIKDNESDKRLLEMYN